MTDEATGQSAELEESETKADLGTDRCQVKSKDKGRSSSLLCSWRWWKNAFFTAALFARHCAVAATIWTLAGTVMIVGSWQGLSGFPHGGPTKIEALIAPFMIMICTLTTTMILMGWALGVWLIKITAFAASLAHLPIGTGPLDRSKTVAIQKECVEATWHRKAYLARFWFYLTLFLLPVIGLLAVLYICKLASTTQVMYEPVLVLTPQANFTLIAVVTWAVLVLTEISLVAMVVSASTALEPFKAAKLAFSRSFQLFFPLMLVTVLVTSLNIVVATPQLLLHWQNPDSLLTMHGDIVELLIQNLWQGITSVMLWTFTVAPVSELLRGKIE